MSRSAYSVIFSIHCERTMRTTSPPQRSQRPSTTSSFARPTLQLVQKLIGISALYASPFSKNFRKIHCVHL